VKKEPLKLMPLDEFGELVGKIAQVPKDAVSDSSSKEKKRKPKATKLS